MGGRYIVILDWLRSFEPPEIAPASLLRAGRVGSARRAPPALGRPLVNRPGLQQVHPALAKAAPSRSF
jgi:hypothetical protein